MMIKLISYIHYYILNFSSKSIPYLIFFYCITASSNLHAETVLINNKYTGLKQKQSADNRSFIRGCVKSRTSKSLEKYLKSLRTTLVATELRSVKEEMRARHRDKCKEILASVTLDLPNNASIKEAIEITAISSRTVLIKIFTDSTEIGSYRKSKEATTTTSFNNPGEYLISAFFQFSKTLNITRSKVIRISANPTPGPSPEPSTSPSTEPSTSPSTEPSTSPSTEPKKPPQNPSIIVSGQNFILEPVEFDVEVTNSNDSPFTYLWNFGDGESSNLKNPIHTFNQSGDFYISVTVSNSGGSSDATKRVRIDNRPPTGNGCILPDQEEPAPYTEAGLWYEDFAKKNLGAINEPLIYEHAGSVLKFDPNSFWRHVSENSAAISWQTNLPTKGFIRYGTDSANLDRSTPITRRFYEQHLQHLKGLSTDIPIFYRVCGIDERDEVIAGNIEVITPTKIPNAKYIPGNMPAAPYVLTSGYYVLTEDIEVGTRAFTIQGNNVTLDLNGHKVVYDKGEPLVKGAWNDYVYSNISTFGVMVNGTSWKVLNGIIQQDPASPSSGDVGIGFNPIYGSNEGEIAGIHAKYSGDDVSGIVARYGSVNVHHNRVDDEGKQITNRHQGLKAFHLASGDAYYNLVSRTRHQGIMGGDLVSSNIVHIDSGATNSFGLNLQGGTQEKTLFKNRVYGTGYHIVAVGWKNGMQAISNYIFMAGLQRFNRSSEYGDHCSLNGFRITQYTGATNEFKNINYLENVVSIHGNSIINQMRPIQLMSNQYVSNILVSGNTFRTHVLDLDLGNATHNNKEFAAVVLHGSTPETSNEIQYRNNIAMSNYRIIMGGDSYAGGGSRHYLYNNTFLREGNSAKFRFGRFGWWSPPTYNNRFLNTTLIGDMTLDKPVFYGGDATRQEYSVGSAYFAKISDCAGNILSGSNYNLTDSKGPILNGAIPNDGIIEIHELDYTMLGSQSVPNGTKTIHTDGLLTVSGRTPKFLEPDWSNQGQTRDSAIEVRLGINGNQCS
jgi:hypothetical protein